MLAGLRSGRVDLELLKVTGSAFTRFVRDEYTTLPERGDRPLYIHLDVHWRYAEIDDAIGLDPPRYVPSEQVRDAVASVFSELVSESIQHLVWEMSERLLAQFPQLSEVSFSAQNRTREPVAELEDDQGVLGSLPRVRHDHARAPAGREPAPVSGRLTTHVLDTAQGRPAGGLAIDLVRLDGAPELLRSVRTNADGRPDEPLLEGDELRVGTYELRFAVGAYFAATRAARQRPAVPRHRARAVSVADPGAHYHVPLLASPWAYSTYRGS